MSRKVSDAWVWLGLGVTLYIGFECVVYTLRHLVESLPDLPDQGDAAKRAANEAYEISSESLSVLSTSQHVNIRKTAVSIFLDRIFSDRNALLQLRQDLESASEEVRHRARNGLTLIYAEAYPLPAHVEAALGIPSFVGPSAPSALADQGYDNVGVFRDLRDVMSGSTVSRARLENAHNILNFLRDNMADLNLTPQEIEEVNEMRVRWPDMLEELQAEDGSSTPTHSRRRVNDGSPQEQARRRRRREAMVLNEGDHPLGQEDIFQRRRTEDAALRP